MNGKTTFEMHCIVNAKKYVESLNYVCIVLCNVYLSILKIYPFLNPTFQPD